MALGSQQRTLTVLLLLLLALCLLLFGESLARGFAGLLQLGGDIFRGSSSAVVAARQRQRAQHVKEVVFDKYHHIASLLSYHWIGSILSSQGVSEKQKLLVQLVAQHSMQGH